MDIERRTNLGETSLEYRDDPQTGMKQPVISGYAAVFQSESRNLGGFTEVIQPGAFAEVLSTSPDVVGCYNHDKNFVLGRTSSGTMTLSEDERGLKYTIYPPEARADVIQAVQRRDVVGSSFAFMCKQEDESWSGTTRGMRLRTIKKISLLDDVGPVVRPAYDSASVIVSRRALETALGDHFRPNLTMANAAKRGLKGGNAGENDRILVGIATKIAERCVITPEEIAYLEGVFERCMDAKTTGWSGSPAFWEYQMAGGDSGAKWIGRRAAEQTSNDVDLKPPADMDAAARRGIELHEAGRSGDGLKPETVARAKRIAARETLTPEHVREMRAWFARHYVDKKEGWSAAGHETPGYTAWMLWGGDPGRRWSESKVTQMDVEKRDDMFDPIMPPKETESDDSSSSSAYDLTPANYQLHEAIEGIAEVNGQWPQDGANGAHYMRESPFAEGGLVCSNCLMFKGGGKCEAVAGEIEAGGVCKLWVIPADKMTMAPADRSEAPPETTPAVVTPVVDYAGRAASLRAALLESVARQ
jgi:HK97 family phage prohead protease